MRQDTAEIFFVWIWVVKALVGGFAVKVNSGASLALHNEKLKQLEASGKSGCGTPAAWGPSAATFIPVFLLTI